MDYDQLAKEFGGVTTPTAPPQQNIDYNALASEFGGTIAPTQKDVDYSALASEFGGAPLSRGTGELLGAGYEAGITGLKSMYEGVSFLRDVGAMDRITNALATYDAIDKGEIKSAAEASQKGLNATSAAKYLRATPEARVQMRENQFGNEEERKALIGDSIKLFQQYQKDMAAQGKGVPNFTDIQSIDGFRQWLTFNLPSSAVQLAPIMAAAVTTGGAGAFTVGAGMSIGETVGNRMEFILDKVKDLPPEEQADKIEKYIRDTRDTTMAVGLASGALDLAGPVGAILRRRAAGEGVKYLTKKEALKAGAKEAPRAIGEEAATGAGQEALQILGEKKLGEMEDDLVSKKNFKRIVDAAAVEALGGKVGAVVNTGVQVADTGMRQRAERIEQEEIDRTLRQAAVQTNATNLDPQFAGLVDKYLAEGKSQAEAFKLAGADLSEREVEVERPEPEPTRVEPSVSVPSGGLEAGRIAGEPAATDTGGLGATPVAPSVPRGGAGTVLNTLEPFRPELTTTYGESVANEILARADEMGVDGATPQAAIDAATTEVLETVEEPAALATVAETPKETEVKAALTETATTSTPESTEEAITVAADTATTAGLDVDTAEDTTQINPATGIKPPGKRGRKKVVRTPEEQAAYETERRATQGASRDAGRTVDRAQKILDIPFDEGSFATDEELAVAQEERNARNTEALTDLFRIANNPKYRKNKPGIRARELIDRFPATDRARVIAEARSKLSEKDAAFALGLEESTNGEVNPIFDKFKDLTSALRYIVKTGNQFEKALAQRIMPFVKGVKVVIVTDISQVPEMYHSKFAGAYGMYSGSGKGGIVYISALPGIDGRSNTVFLHEAIHGATLARINAYIENPKSLSPKTQQAMEELYDTMFAASDFYDVIKARADADPAIAQRFKRQLHYASEFAKFDVFTNVKEFVAYGLSQPEFQEFLIQVPGRFRPGATLNKNLFTRFVTSIRKIFNLGPEHHSAFQDLVIVSDKLMRSPDLLMVGDLLQGVRGAFEAVAAKKVKPAKKAKVDKVTVKIFFSNKYSELNASVGELMAMVRNSKDAVDLLKSLYGAMSVGALRKMLPTLTTQDITRWAGDRITNLRNVNRAVQEMAGMRAKMIRELAEKVPEWVNFAKKYQQAGRLLGDLMHRSTLTQVDPTKYADLATALQNDSIVLSNETKANDMNLTPNQRRYHQGEVTKRKNELTRVYSMWEQLGKVANGKGQEIFRMARQTYLDTFNLHQSLLIDKIAASNVPGDINDASTPKGKLMASITRSFQDAASMDIYFPLMRYGNFWLRVGKGKGSEFYMFETATARNNAIRKRIEEMQKAGDKRSFDEIIESQEVDFGDDLRQMRAEIVESSQMLKSIFQMLDQNKLTDVEALKDQVYQMYLMTLPEKDIRKRFTHRQGKTGFSADVIRNFIVSQHTAANQLSRLKYSDKIRNSIGAAYAEMAGNPDKLKLNAFIDEISMRAGAEMSPPIAGDFDWNKLASIGNQAVFYYMLTAPKSALVQMTQLPTVGLPVLLANYDTTEVAKIVGRYSWLFNKFGTTKRDAAGNVVTEWGQPSIRDSRYVNEHPDLHYRDILRNAWEYANDRDIFMSTYTADMTSRAKVPTGQYEKLPKRTLRAVGSMMSGAFHHLERVSRETMYMSTFELEFAKQKKAGKSDVEASAIAKEKAIDIVYESLFNYTQYNKPRLMKTPVGRVATQFLSYPLQVTSYLYRNFKNMWPYFNKEGKREAAIQFFGTVGMTAMFSGVVGLPMYSMIMGMVDALRDMWRPEDDEDYDEDDEGNPLAYRSMDLWFREWFIPHYFGEGSSIAKAFGLTDEQADTLARAIKMGPISAYTNLNIGASVSLDGLWFRDDTPADDSKSAIQEMFFNTFGGPLGSGITQVMSGFEDINNGQWERGVEKLMPAFFRGSMKAYRLHTEGLKTTKGDEVMNAEYYTTGRLIGQAMGFEPTEVAEVQKANFMAKRLETQITKEKTDLLNKLDIAVRRDEDRMTDATEKAVDDVLDKIDKYNVKNGFGPFLIDQKTIQTSLEGREKRRGQSYQGLSVPTKAAPFIEPLVEKSRSPAYR